MSAEKSIHDGHRERMRERFVRYGLSGFAPHEVLELILFYAVPRRDTNALAHRILDRFGGSLDNVFSASPEMLESVKGVGHNAAVLIRLFSETMLRLEFERNREVRFLNTFSEVGTYLMPYFRDLDREVIVVLGLDGKKKVRYCRPLFEGSFNSAGFSPKTLIDALSPTGTVFLFMAHNHPSGNAMPSASDIRSTSALMLTLSQIGIVLVDHLVFADNDYTSMAQSGVLDTPPVAYSLFHDSAPLDGVSGDIITFD